MNVWSSLIFASLIFAQDARAAAGPVLDQNCQHERTTFRCVKYIRNYDADTITFEIKGVHPLFGENIPVRVAGIDTPEVATKNACEKETGRIAKKLIESVLKQAKRIDLINVERDKYFRILADVMVDGKSVKEILLKNQLAVAYDGGTKSKVDWCPFLKRKPAGL